MDDDTIPGLVFTVNNRHVASCGSPPAIDGNVPHRYTSYFENEHGEQAVFVYDYDADTATLWMGDCDWEKPISIVDGKPVGIILDAAEALWLQACWLATAPVREHCRRGNYSPGT